MLRIKAQRGTHFPKGSKMKRYEIYIKQENAAKLRHETDSLDEACDAAHEIERSSKEDFEATAIYDTKERKWIGYHKRGAAYILAK